MRDVSGATLLLLSPGREDEEEGTVEEVDGEGMKEMESVPLNLTTETASATGMTATMGLG